MQQQDLIPHLFRTEFSKITAVLCRLLGLSRIDVAEDIASDTFMLALETWTYKGIPPNPAAWLYTVARNKTITYLKRESVFNSRIAPDIQYHSNSSEEFQIDLSAGNISDSQLQMLFAICHPSLPGSAQICLALRILCGFGIDEIANALLTNRETVNKRLLRAKEKLRQQNIQIEFPGIDQMQVRLSNVLTTLYLLFNEGYYSESNDAMIREELCLEAMRLTFLLLENQATNMPHCNALLALMCFHASRFAARKDINGDIILYQDQDETLWNTELITKGIFYLNLSATGNVLSKYHLEASIAYWHTIKMDTSEKWEEILQLYNRLLQLEYTPLAALNRTFALSKVQGKAAAIAAAEKLNLPGNRFYFLLLADLYSGIDDSIAVAHLENALSLTKNVTEKRSIVKRLQTIKKNSA